MNIRKSLQQSGIAPTRKRGQNFLVQQQTAERIIDLAGVDHDDTIIELGVGLGALTIPLAERVKKVVGIEVDAGIIRYHETRRDLPGNVELIHADLLATDYNILKNTYGDRLKIIANLPYSITGPLLFMLVKQPDIFDWAVLMLQKEVGERLIAAPGTRQYGVITVLLAECAVVRKLLDVSPGHFHPRPRVDSVVVRIRFLPEAKRMGSLTMPQRNLLRQIVNAAFQQRRKTVQNALHSAGFHRLDKNAVGDILSRAGIKPGVRAEQLGINDYISLTRLFETSRKTPPSGSHA